MDSKWEVIFMKILVDEMPACKDNCWFSDTRWVDDHWEPYCILGPDEVTDCDLENGECSKLRLLMEGDIYENQL